MSLETAIKTKQTKSLLNHLKIEISDVHKYTYESCSFVVGLKDMKTLTEICFCPGLIETWEETENPLFN